MRFWDLERFVKRVCGNNMSKDGLEKRVTRLPLDSLELLTGDFDIEYRINVTYDPTHPMYTGIHYE